MAGRLVGSGNLAYGRAFARLEARHELLRRNHGPGAPTPTCPAARCSRARRLIASAFSAGQAAPAIAQGRQIKLAYCSQLLCGVPYEVARSAGIFKTHGLDVQFVYTRGGSAAMQALVGGAVDYAATSLDVAIQAYANVGADIRRFAVTGRLPLFALATAPKTADTDQGDQGPRGQDRRRVNALGKADHALTLYLLTQAGADARKVQFATMGVNLLEALRQGQVDVGLVQEPALTLLQRAGGRVLMNAMDLEDAKKLSRRHPTSSWASRCAPRRSSSARPEMIALTKALADALKALRSMSGDQLSRGVPQGDDDRPRSQGVRRDHRCAHRDSLYPEAVTIDLDCRQARRSRA